MNRPLILAYHSISQNVYPGISKAMSVKPICFEKQIKSLLKAGFVNIEPDIYLKCLQGHRYKIPKRSFIITFDDGFSDNYHTAFPILKKYNLGALIFLTASFVDSSLWFEGDQQENDIALTTKQIGEMQSYGIIFGSHGMDHSKLSSLSTEDQELNMRDSKHFIQNITGSPVRYYCAPYGDYSKTSEELAKKYYDASFLIKAKDQERQNSFVWHRVGIYRHNSMFAFWIKIIKDVFI